MKKSLLLLFSVVAILILPKLTWAQIASWDFTGQNTGPATVTATASNPDLASVPVLTRGSGATANTANNSFRTQGFGSDGISTSNNDYFEVRLSAKTGKKLSLSTLDAKFAGTSTFYASPGVTSQFAYSLDDGTPLNNGTSFTLIGSPVTSTALTLTQINLSSVTALQNVAAGTTVILRYYASGQTPTGGWGFNSSASGTNGFAIGGSTTNSGSAPTLTASTASLDFGNQATNVVSAEKSYTLSGSNLTNENITVSTAAPYSVSKTSGSGFSTTLTFNSTDFSSTSQTVYVRYLPTSGGISTGNIAISGGGTTGTQSVALTGTGISGTVSSNKTALNFPAQTVGTTSTAQTYTLSGTGLTNDVTVSVAAPFSISKDGLSTTYKQSVTYTAAEISLNPTVFVQFSPTSAVTSNENILNISTNAFSATVSVSGTGIAAATPTSHVLISEVYGGGGNTGAPYKNDFIELYNPTDVPVDLTGWSVQYASATGTTGWQVTPLSGSIPAKSFYLIQEAGGANGTNEMPTPDATGVLALSATAGKVLLANTTAAQNGIKPSGSNIVDLVGYGSTANGYLGAGPTQAPSNTTSIERKASAASTATSLALNGSEEFDGNGYNTDNNNTDFVVQLTPNPQNTSVKEPVGANHIVISQVYGGGGNSGSVYKNDFIELYNPTLSTIDLTGWSVQYSSATNTTWAATNLTGSIAPRSYYLVQEAAGTGGTTALPTPDAIGTINMAAGAGKVLLSNARTLQSGAFPNGAAVIDLVGYGATNGYEGSGPAPVPTATLSVQRKASITSDAATMGPGGTEEFMGNGFDSDDNTFDFILATAKPQNSSITAPPSRTGPYFILTPKALAFGNQAINSTSLAKTYIISSGNLTGTTTVTASAPFLISKTNTGPYISSLTYTTNELSSNQTVYVKFNPAAAGNATGSISHVSNGAATLNLALTGVGIDPNQTSFDFENCTVVGSPMLSDGFYQYSVTGPQTWGCTTNFGHDMADATGTASKGNALQINGYSGGNIQNEDWLISPALNLSAMNYAVLSFWTRSAFAGDKLQLKLSTNYTGTGNPSAATWIDLDGKFPETGSDIWTKSDNIDLSAYKGTPVYIAFVYHSTNLSASRWTVDDFAVTNSSTPPAVDISTSTATLSFGFQAAGTTSAEKTFSFSAGNLTDDVTLTAPTNFSISKTSGGSFTKSLTYAKATANNISQTVYVRFSPNVNNTTYNEKVTIATNGTGNKTVSLTGNTFDTASSLQVVNWNIEWFGSPAQAPNDDQLQAANVSTIVNSIKADIYGFAEVVDTTLFRNKVLPAGYSVIFSDFGSYAADKNDAGYDLAQKLAFMYRTDIIKPLKTFGVLRDTYNPAIPATSADGTPYKNWSSGRFPYLMQAEVKINNKVDTVYFIEIHAKANTGTTAAQIDSYNRRKDGNLQFKTWIDANLAGKKVLILGDFNDVLDANKTIAPMPAGTGTSYSDFTNDTENYYPVTLPLSLAGKQSTTGFATVIDNVIISKSLKTNYIPESAEVLDGVKSLVASYSTTTTDHYPVKSRYIFGNGAPTLNAISDQSVCYSATNQTIALTGISAGPETAQTTSLSITSDNAGLFDVLTVQPLGTDKGTITYHLKNNVSGTANITVTVMDNGGTDFGGIDKITKTFKLTVNATPTATLSGTTSICLNGTAPVVTFTGANGTAPYTFTYNINGGTNQTVTSAGSGNTATVTAPVNVAGNFAYNLVSVGTGTCTSAQTGTATITVRPLATATVTGTTAVCLNGTAPVVTFTGANGTAPYTFTYNINGGTNQTVTSTGSGNTATVTVPVNVAGNFAYNLVSVGNGSCTSAQTGTATITVRSSPTATVSGTTAVCLNGTAPVLTFTGANGTAPYTFTYNINGGTNQTVTSTANTATVTAPATVAGNFVYNLVSVSDVNCTSVQTGTATVTIRTLPTASISGTTTVNVNASPPVITFTGATGAAPYTFTYNINNGTNRTVSTTTGNSVTVAVPTNAAGTFTYNLVSVNDVNCSQVQTGTATVTVRALPVATISGTASVCINGTPPVITFTGSVGTAPYTFTYSVNGNIRTITTSTTVATLNAPVNSAGTFTYALVSVADAYASQAQTGTAVITVNPQPNVQITANGDLTISKGSTLELTATGGTQYSWTGNDIISGQTSATAIVRPKQSGAYKVTVTNSSGCTADKVINIQVIEDYKLEASTLITPNGDGVNDKFIIKNVDYYPNNTLKIFDKSGRVIYTQKAYANQWDGTLNGSPLAEGTYYYILDLGTGLGNFKGYINIIRD